VEMTSTSTAYARPRYQPPQPLNGYQPPGLQPLTQQGDGVGPLVEVGEAIFGRRPQHTEAHHHQQHSDPPMPRVDSSGSSGRQCRLVSVSPLCNARF
jgi:hypothetical protein